MEYNIYCDESCHLPNDESDIMVIGGICCPKEKVRMINDEIRKIKKKNGVYEYAEIKWTKVSDSKLNMYKELIDLFLDYSFLNFRAVVALNKKALDFERFAYIDYDDWYYRIYYLVLKELINIDNKYYIYIDKKDTLGSEKIDNLKNVLNNYLYDFYDETVKNVQLVRSDQIQIMQLADLIIGAVSYSNRGLHESKAKQWLIDYIYQKSGIDISKSTRKFEHKLNIFKWSPQ